MPFDDRISNAYKLACHHTLEFPRFGVEEVLRAVFERLAPGRVVPAVVTSRSHNYDVTDSYVTAEGDGLRVNERSTGAVLGEGLEQNFALLVRDELLVSATLERDTDRDTFELSLRATPEMIDVAADALLEITAARGLALVRRTRGS